MSPDATKYADLVREITRHQAMLRAYVISLMPGVDGVDDVLQETNLVLWEKWAKFEPGTNFGAWACAVARLEVKTHRRKRLRLGEVMLDEDLTDDLAEECFATVGEVDDRLRALDRCLGKLQENERQLVEHRYYSKVSLEEFAARCGRPVQSLWVSLFRIRSGLRKCINAELATLRVLP